MDRTFLLNIVAAAALVMAASPVPPSAALAQEASPLLPAGEPAVEGIARPNRQVTLKATVIARLRAMEVEEGEMVFAGDIVAQLDDRVQGAAVEQMRMEAASTGEIVRTAAVVAEARLVLEHTRQMHERSASTDWELKRAELSLEQAEAAHQAAQEQQTIREAALQLERERLEEYRFRAPFDSHVLRVHINQGATVTDEEPVVTLASLDPLEAELHLPAELYNSVHVGGHYVFQAETPVDARIVGICKTRTPALDPASHTVRYVFTIPNPESRLPANFKVRLLGQAVATPASD